MRQSLLECCELDWGKISPAIFGSMFQSVMDKNARRNLGAHYTSEKNILKLIKPLFLDNLWKEFENLKTNDSKLRSFHRKIASLRFLDPACGCGNFLVITYRELRLLELAILKSLQKGQRVFDLESLIQCNVDRFYGIEYEEFPSQIAQVALWLIDHQMNMLVSAEFGEYFVRLPLKKSAMIVHGNALQIEWQTLLNPVNSIDIVAKHTNIYLVNEPIAEFRSLNVKTETYNVHKGEPPITEVLIKFDYILGNPPFVGKQMQNPEQKADMELIFTGVHGSGVLDYVSAWYIKSAKYLQKYNTEEPRPDRKTLVAFVSTNSIAQGEQVGIIWNDLFNRYQIKIHFAHRTFKWGNEAKANAAVHVVIIGFSNFDIPEKQIFEYENISGEPHELKAKNINPYLVEGKDFVILSRKLPICIAPKMMNGSMPNDEGNLILTTEEKDELIRKQPRAEKYIRKFVGAYEFLNNKERWCIWLQGILPEELNSLSEILERVKRVKKFRENSTRDTTRNLANFPYLFGEIRQPEHPYIIAPVVSSVNRKYIPIDIYSEKIIVSNLCNILPVYSYFAFGIISSGMMMTWIRTIAGRLKSDWRLTKDNVYNNFPWPENSSEKQRESIEADAQTVLDVRGFRGLLWPICTTRSPCRPRW
jgi:type II restriction/modification system DNA methylase subunit YeeA